MGLLFVIRTQKAILGVWEVTESLEELIQQVNLSPGEQVFYQQLSSPLRKKHWLAYRMILPHLLDEEPASGISYDPFGKPILDNGAGHISVAHSGRFATMIYSRIHQVGIDIEAIQPKIIKLVHKFLSPCELEYKFSAHLTESLCLIWCAKEALYKMYGGRGIVFSEHLHVDPFFYEGTGQITGSVIRKGKIHFHRIHYETIDDYLLVYLCD